MFLKKFGFFKANTFFNKLPRNDIFLNQSFNFATKMRAGVTKNKKDSAGKRLGVKKFGGEEVLPGQILVRQRGFEWKKGENIYHGRDHTFHAGKEGKVSFSRDPWSVRRRTHVHVIEQEIPNRYIYPPKPFMYHPELYPELAQKNKLLIPLKFSNDESRKQRISSNNQNIEKENKQEELKEVKLEDLVSGENKNFLNLKKMISRAARKRGRYTEENATNYFQIKSIKEEINETGVIYFGINNYKNRSEVIDNYMNIMEADKKDELFEFNTHTKSIIQEKYDHENGYLPSYLIEKNRLNYMKTDAPSLGELIQELKTENRISNVNDYSGIPSSDSEFDMKIRNPQENLKKIKEYFHKIEKKNAEKIIKKVKGKNVKATKDGKKEVNKGKNKKVNI